MPELEICLFSLCAEKPSGACNRKTEATLRLATCIQPLRPNYQRLPGDGMNRLVFGLVFTALLFHGSAYAQAPPSPADAQPGVPAPAQEFKATPVPPSSDSQSPSGDARAAVSDAASLLPDLPSLPKGKATLVGGTIQKLDRVQDRLTLQVFGGDKLKVLFDTRTRIYQDGLLASVADLRQGDRVYVDTMLDGSAVFARNISIRKSASLGESHGVILRYSSGKGELVMRDALSPQAVKVRVTPATKITQGDHTVSPATLSAGTLIAVKFGSESNGRDVAREVSILAVPGASFTFQGQVTALDLRTGLLVVTSPSDRKNYEIYLDPAARVDSALREGVTVSVMTKFDGSRYVARSLTINPSAAP